MTTIVLKFSDNTRRGIYFRIIRQDVVNREEGTEKVCRYSRYSNIFNIVSCDFPDIANTVMWLRGARFTEDNNCVWVSDKGRFHTVFDAFLFSCDRFIKPERINL